MDLSTMTDKQVSQEEGNAYQFYKQCCSDTLSHRHDKFYFDFLDREISAFNKFYNIKEEKEKRKKGRQRFYEVVS